MPCVRIELTTFRLWDWRAAYCANKAQMRHWPHWKHWKYHPTSGMYRRACNYYVIKRHTMSLRDKWPWEVGSTETWTRIAGFRVLSANHYTMEPKRFFPAWFRPGSNRGPFACKANVITTTLRNRYFNGQNCGVVDWWWNILRWVGCDNSRMHGWIRSRSVVVITYASHA